MKHVFIVNSISGKGCAISIVDTITKICQKNNLEFVIEKTEYVGHAKELALEYSSQDNVIIYAVGGDGTLLEVVNGLNNKTPLGIIPAGSGNDFYRYFFGVRKDFENIIEETINAEPILIDIGETNQMKFLNTTSLGIDAIINYDASKIIRKTFITKGPAYILSIIKNMITLSTVKVKLTVDGKKMDDNYVVVSCMNGKYYGNGVESAPNSDVKDGYFDLVLFKYKSRLHTYSKLMKYLKGKATEEDGVRRIRCKEVIISSNSQIACQSDGENILINDLKINILHNYLKLKMPIK